MIGAISLAVFIRFNVFVYQWMKEWESAAGTGTGTDSWWMQALWMLPFWILPFMLVFSAIGTLSFRKAQMFHLVWNQIGIGQIARFRCNLRTRKYVGLCLKNLTLTIFTAGFYRPFARVSEYRMRLESVTLHLKGQPDQLAGELVLAQGSGVGDAIADALGMDLIS